MATNPPNIDFANGKPLRLIEYLLRIASLRSNPVRDVSTYEKVLWICDIPQTARGCFAQAWGRNEDYDSDIWIEVRNRREPELPSIPDRCKAWVDNPSLRIKTEFPSLLKQISRQIANASENPEGPEFVTVVEQLDEFPEIQEAWDRYLEDRWMPWVVDHNSWEAVHKVYSTLFAIHQDQLRLGEEYELVIGLGLLKWQTPSGQCIRRHLIVADAILEFEAHLAKFTIRPNNDGAKVRPELDMLDIEEQPARAEENAKTALVGAGDDPWERLCIENVLRSLVHSLDARGEYDETLTIKDAATSSRPVAEYAPALILRKRSAKGLTDTLKRIRTLIEQGVRIPGEFADIAEVSRDTRADSAEDDYAEVINTDQEIYFPKPSNEEQRRIVEKLRAANGVLVQGPPGTGKSHTIANLICHLVATGQRILITAKTPRALQVLEHLLSEELRPLCINLLGSGIEERRSLEASVGGILRKNGEWNEKQATTEIASLRKTLNSLREEQVSVNRRLREIRESETYSFSVADGHYIGTAARIAEKVNVDKPRFDWFNDLAPCDSECPFEVNSLRDSLESLRYFTPERRQELGFAGPTVSLSPEEFASLVEKEKLAAEAENNSAQDADKSKADSLTQYSNEKIERLRHALVALQSLKNRVIASPQRWVGNAIRDILSGTTAPWYELAKSTREVTALIAELVDKVDKTSVEIREDQNPVAVLRDATVLRDHMLQGGKLGWGPFRARVVKERIYLLKGARVNGKVCKTADQLTELVHVLTVRIECEKAWQLWMTLTERSHGSYGNQLRALTALCNTLEYMILLPMEDLIAKCLETLRDTPSISQPAWSDDRAVDSMIASCRVALARKDRLLVGSTFKQLEDAFILHNSRGMTHPVTVEMIDSIRLRDVDCYAKATHRIQKLLSDKTRLRNLEDTLAAMRTALPLMTDELVKNYDADFWPDRIKEFQDTWQWSRAKHWVTEHISNVDSAALSQRARQIEDEMGSAVARLAGIHAWSYCFSRLEEDHRRHMEAWQQSMRRLGKGTGKYAPRHRREAQDHLNKCREAVPAWVMPLHRIWDTVDPSPGMFDIVIVDEASQCGLEALPLFFLGKKILIVGDDKQISPDAVGLPRDAVVKLMEEYLFDFKFASSFDIESSLFDHGKLRYATRQITLREHFRCMPEIIRFSNDLCYSDTPLIPLRQYGPDRLVPVERVFVSTGYRRGSNQRAENPPEAEAVVKRIVEMCRDPRYKGKTMGVVILQGEAQASLIERQLLDSLGAEELEKRRLICGNPYSFQGDERDIVFISMVAATNERIGPLTKTADERRFNVAASRARDQLILFHSVECDDLSTLCLRRRLLEFFENSRPLEINGLRVDELEQRAIRDNRAIVKPPAPFDSWFEVDVALELLRRRYVVVAQYPFAGKRIDLVVEGGHARLAVECDGDYWHGVEQWEADMERQWKLERCQWEFVRVRESAFHYDKNSALRELWEKLEERGIKPNGFSAAKEEAVGDEAETSEIDEAALHEDGVSDESIFEIFVENDNQVSADLPLVVSGRRPDEIKSSEIHNAIVTSLSRCPNLSCTLHSLTARVLRELSIITRGSPRRIFERRVLRGLNFLEDQGIIEKYKAKNHRIRLLRT